MQKKSKEWEARIEQVVDSYETKSNWDRYFSKRISIDGLEEKWKELYELRNCTAHTRRIRNADYKKAAELIEELQRAFSLSLTHLNDIEVTEDQAAAVMKVAKARVINSITQNRIELSDAEMEQITGGSLFSQPVYPVRFGGGIVSTLR